MKAAQGAGRTNLLPRRPFSGAPPATNSLIVNKAEMKTQTLETTTRDLCRQYTKMERCKLEHASGKAARKPAIIGACQ